MCTQNVELRTCCWQNVGRKMTVDAFVENLRDLNDGGNFPIDSLRPLYLSIKQQPLEMEL